MLCVSAVMLMTALDRLERRTVATLTGQLTKKQVTQPMTNKFNPHNLWGYIYQLCEMERIA